MIKMLSQACGGELDHKDVVRNCASAACAVVVITLWGFCCFSLLSNFSG